MATTKSQGISSEVQARRELARLTATQQKLEEAKRKAGIPKLETEIEMLRERITNYMAESGIERLEGRGLHATLIRGFHSARFVGTKDDLSGDEGRQVIPLRTILLRKFDKATANEIWRRVTKRVVVKEAVEEVVAEGLLSVEEISPAFVEQAKKPYVRIFKNA